MKRIYFSLLLCFICPAFSFLCVTAEPLVSWVSPIIRWRIVLNVWTVLCLVSVVAACRKSSKERIPLILIGSLILIPPFLEFIPLGRELWIFSGVTIASVAAIALKQVAQIHIWAVTTAAIISQQIVFMYNLIAPYQASFFIKRGWTT